MSSSSIQFHALPDELLEFSRSIMKEFNLYCTHCVLKPFRAELLDEKSVSNGLIDPKEKTRLFFTPELPNLFADSGNAFSDKNPKRLLLQIGSLTKDGLSESWITYQIENDKTEEVFKKIVSKLKKMTKSGAIAVNPNTSETSQLKNHRYTVEASKLDAQGIPILPAAGTAKLHFK